MDQLQHQALLGRGKGGPLLQQLGGELLLGGQGGLLGEELRHGDAQGLADALQGGHRGHVVAQKQVGQGGLGHTGLLGQAVDAPAPLLQQCSNAFQAVHSVAPSLPFFTRLHYIGDRKH